MVGDVNEEETEDKSRVRAKGRYSRGSTFTVDPNPSLYTLKRGTLLVDISAALRVQHGRPAVRAAGSLLR